MALFGMFGAPMGMAGAMGGLLPGRQNAPAMDPAFGAMGPFLGPLLARAMAKQAGEAPGTAKRRKRAATGTRSLLTPQTMAKMGGTIGRAVNGGTY